MSPASDCSFGIRGRSALLVLAGVVSAFLAACAAPPETVASAREIDLAAFAVATAPEPSEPSDPPPRSAAPAAPLGASGPSGAIDDGTDGDWRPVSQEEPARTPSRRIEPGERVIIDGMVGQVNGYPIFADAFFEPIADRLVALRGQVARPEEYPAQAAQIVTAELQQVVLNALFLAEAEADLTIEERQGIYAGMQQLASQVISGFQGSEELARQQIYEVEGRSFEEHMKTLRDQYLIQQLIRERIAPRILVSWKDIEREYERRIDEFRPPPRITIARIRLATSDTSAIEEVQRRLAAGEMLPSVAEAVGQGAGAAWQTFEVEGGDLGTIDIANDVIRAELAGLHAEGDVAGPFEIGASTWWLGIAAIEQEPQKDLYDIDVQRRLEAQIRQVRGGEEQERYIASLLDKGIYDELEDMAQRLLIIALHRYGP